MLAIVEWFDARGINSNCQLLLTRKTPDQILKGLTKVTVGFCSVDKDTLVIAQELEIEDGRTEIHDVTLVPKVWIKKVRRVKISSPAKPRKKVRKKAKR